MSYIEGVYSKWPRIDKELLLKYSKGLIATSCCIGAEVPQAILWKSEDEAEEIFKWWLDVFGEDYYIEIQRHGLMNIDGTGKSQEDINQVLLQWAQEIQREGHLHQRLALRGPRRLARPRHAALREHRRRAEHPGRRLPDQILPLAERRQEGDLRHAGERAQQARPRR